MKLGILRIARLESALYSDVGLHHRLCPGDNFKANRISSSWSIRPRATYLSPQKSPGAPRGAPTIRSKQQDAFPAAINIPSNSDPTTKTPRDIWLPPPPRDSGLRPPPSPRCRFESRWLAFTVKGSLSTFPASSVSGLPGHRPGSCTPETTTLARSSSDLCMTAS